MTLKKSTLVLITLCLSQMMLAQRDPRSYRMGVDRVNGSAAYNVTAYGITEDEYNSADGSPYLDKTYAPGTIKSGDKVTKAFMRYNVFFEEIEVSEIPNPENNKKTGALLKDGNTQAVFNDKTFVYMMMGNGENQKGVYFQILSTGNHFDLYMKSTVKYLPPQYAYTSIDHDMPGRFEMKHQYFMVSKQNRFIPIPEKHKDLLKMISYKQDEVKNFLKKEHIKLSEPEDVKKFMLFYNKLQG